MIVTGLFFVPLNRALRNTFSTLKILNLTHRVTYTTQHLCISLVYPLIYVVLPILSYKWLKLLTSIVQGVQTKPTMTAKMLVGERWPERNPTHCWDQSVTVSPGWSTPEQTRAVSSGEIWDCCCWLKNYLMMTQCCQRTVSWQSETELVKWENVVWKYRNIHTFISTGYNKISLTNH